MADVPVEAIRQSQRYELTINRKKLKHEENDLRRSISGLRLTEVDLPALANKLKTKSAVTVGGLRALKNLLIQDEDNIRLVLSTPGALRGLVREITGTEVNRQAEAAGCLCNLALADSRGCLAVIDAAGAYIIAALDSQNLELSVTCAWTLGNLCGGGAAPAQRLAAAGVCAALCAQAREPVPRRARSGVAALTLYAHAMGDLLSKEHLDLIVRSVGLSLCRSIFQLFYILSCHKDFSDPDRLVQSQLIYRFPQMMTYHHNSCVSGAPSCCDLLFAIRTLANMERGRTYYHFLLHMHDEPQRSRDFLDLIKDPRFKVSMLWLYGNMGWRQDREYFIKHFDPMAQRVPPPPPPAADPLGPHPDLHADSPRRGLAAFRHEEPDLPAPFPQDRDDVPLQLDDVPPELAVAPRLI